MTSIIHKSLYKRMKTSKLSLEVCPITGIIIEINAPFLPSSLSSKILSYENPLSRIENARELALLPYSELSKVSPHILAGIFLTLLTHYSLIEDHLSSTERNELLCTIPTYYLCEAINFIASQTARRIAIFPHISLDIKSFNSSEIKYDSIYSLVRNYIFICNENLLPSIYSYSSDTEVIKKEKKEAKEEALSIEAKKRIKNIISTLIDTNTLPNKLVNLLKLLTQGNNLVLMSSSVRNKLIEVLADFPLAFSLKEELEAIRDSIQNVESLFKQEKAVEEEFESFSDNLPSYGKKLSLKEILESKKNKQKIEIINKEEDDKDEF